MHIFGIGIQSFFAIFIIIHILKTGQDRSWIYLVWIPFLGPLAYFLMIILPLLLGTHRGYKLIRGVKNILNPDRELKEAQEHFDQVPTLNHRLRLANALLAKEQYVEAIFNYKQSLTGEYEHDPDIMLKLAYAQFESGDVHASYQSLDDFRVHHPKINSPNGYLLYARCCAALLKKTLAIEEFESLIGYFVGFEAKVRYIEALILWQDFTQAHQKMESLMQEIRRAPRHAKDLNAQWIALAKTLAIKIKQI